MKTATLFRDICLALLIICLPVSLQAQGGVESNYMAAPKK